MAMAAKVLMLHLLPLFFFFCTYSDAQSFNHPLYHRIFSAKPHSQWKNNPSLQMGSYNFSDGSNLRPILCINTQSNDSNTPPFGLGFFANDTKDAFYLVVFMLVKYYPDDSTFWGYPPIVIWSANRDHPVGENSTLDFTAEGNLVLKDFDGSSVWSTNTSGYSITGMNITMEGNLILYDSTGFVIWESFDYPTDTWLPNQDIPAGKGLISRSSPSNLSSGMFFLSVANNGVFAFIDSVPPKTYITLLPDFPGSISVTINLFQGNARFYSDDFEYIRLESNGHLNAYKVTKSFDEFDVQLPYDILEDYQFGQCVYPTVCGNYGICSNGQCSCVGCWLDCQQNWANIFHGVNRFFTHLFGMKGKKKNGSKMVDGVIQNWFQQLIPTLRLPQLLKVLRILFTLDYEPQAFPIN